MSREDGLARADTDTSLYADPKLIRLWRLLRDVDRMARATTLYEAVRLASARAGERVSAEDAAPLWMDDVARSAADLAAAELLDEDGRLPIHAYESWIGSAILRVQQQRERDRNRKRKDRQDQGEDARQESGRSPGGQEPVSGRTEPEVRAEDGPVRGSQPAIRPASQRSQPAIPPVDDEPDVLDAWYRLTASSPSAKVTPWLDRLEREHGGAPVIAALVAAFGEDPDRSTLLSRTQDRLWRESHEASKEAERRKREEAEAEARRIDEMSPEQRAANMARLRESLTANGILPEATGKRGGPMTRVGDPRAVGAER